MNPQLVKIFLQSERQWCSTCQKEVNARDNRSLPFSEYGINTVMLIVLLRFKAHCSVKNIATIIETTSGLPLSKSAVTNVLQRAGGYLGKCYEELKKAVREGAVLYADETGWLVHGQKAWMWIMASEKATVYIAAESRGKGIAEALYGDSSAYAMTDGLGSYTNTIPEEKHLYCWAHVLRFAYEETVDSDNDSQAVRIREELVQIYRIKKEQSDYTQQQFRRILRGKLDTFLAIDSDEQSCRAGVTNNGN